MRVLHVIAIMDPVSGGLSQGLRNNIPELAKQGVVSEVVCLDDPGSGFIGEDPFILKALGPGKTAWCYSSALLPWLRENMTRFDSVIVHGLWQYTGYAVTKASKELNKKMGNSPRIYIMPHGMLDPYFQKAPERKFKAIRNWIIWQIVESGVIKKANALLFTCSAELLLARQTFTPYTPKRELNIGFGIQEPPQFTMHMKEMIQSGHPELIEKPYLLFLSRIHPKKGANLLIEAYKVVYGNPEEKNVPELVIAGPGLDTPYGQSMIEMVNNDAFLHSNVKFTGMISGELKWSIFYHCEVFILPSHQENFGIAVAEAMACGKPVLISDQVNICHEIKEGKAGFVEKDNLDGTVSLLKNWKKQSLFEKLEMGKNARKVYESKFSIVPAARQMLEAISN